MIGIIQIFHRLNCSKPLLMAEICAIETKENEPSDPKIAKKFLHGESVNVFFVIPLLVTRQAFQGPPL